MPLTDSQLAALSTADRLAVRLRSLRKQRALMADWRARRAAEPPEITAGRVADVLAATGPLHRDAVRRKLNLSAAALTAAIDHGVEAGLFHAEQKPVVEGKPSPTLLHLIVGADGPRRYRKADPHTDEAYNTEFRRLALEHFAKLPLAEQVAHQPKLDQFLLHNHMRGITAEVVKRGGTPDEAHDLAVRMLYGGSTQTGSPLFADHDLSKSSYLTRFVNYRNNLAPKYAGGGLNADVTAGRVPTFSGLEKPDAETDFASGVSKAVRQTDAQPASGKLPKRTVPADPRNAVEEAKRKANAAALPDSYYVQRIAAAVTAAGATGLPHKDLARGPAHRLPAARIADVKRKAIAAGHAVERVVAPPLGVPGKPTRRLYAPQHDPGDQDPRLDRLRQVAELLKRRATPTQIKDALGLKSREHAAYLAGRAKAKLKFAAGENRPHPLFDNDAGKALLGLRRGLHSLSPYHPLLERIDDAYATADPDALDAIQDYARSMPHKTVGWMVHNGYWADAADHGLLADIADAAAGRPYRYNKVEYFTDLAEPEAVLRYARWKDRPYYVVFRTKGGKKKRRIVRFDGTHDDLHAECERRGHTLLYSEPATDAHAQIVGAAANGGGE